VLAEQVADREAQPERVAGKFLDWSWKLGRANRAGLTTAAFIRRELERLQLGDEVTAVYRGKRTFHVAPPEPSARSKRAAPSGAGAVILK
jgi:hypothetical protein